MSQAQNRMSGKKLKVPPIKVACVPCRVARIRCDGGERCHNCISRMRECSYVASKRGGSRKARVNLSNVDVLGIPRCPNQAVSFAANNWSNLQQINHLIAPGAGLKHPDIVPAHYQGDGKRHDGSAASSNGGDALRVYGSAEAILNAYYTLIHAYFPILPPPDVPIEPDRPIYWPSTKDFDTFPYISNSPLSLAISAVLALIPLRQDGRYDVAASAPARRFLAHKFARAALERVEEDSGYINYIAQYHSGTPDQRQPISRKPFHPLAPVEIEAILALIVLSNYEHTQRGNLLNMATRAGQALIMAKSLSLHRLGLEQDKFSQARRRAWWMTASITVGDDSDFTTPYPRLESDPEAWSIFIESLRISVASVQFTVRHGTCMKPQMDVSTVHEQMEKLDKWVVHTTVKAEITPPISPIAELDPVVYEVFTAHVMRYLSRIRLSSARIRLHRYQAFADVPLFVNNYCDLAPVDDFNLLGKMAEAIPANASTTFTCDRSAGICVESALAVARQLRSLPAPTSINSNGMLPLTMPTCSCCAMQAIYALLMQLFKIRAMSQISSTLAGSPACTDRLMEELRHGLKGIIEAMSDFANSFEAIGGMRDEVETAFQVAFQ